MLSEPLPRHASESAPDADMAQQEPPLARNTAAAAHRRRETTVQDEISNLLDFVRCDFGRLRNLKIGYIAVAIETQQNLKILRTGTEWRDIPDTNIRRDADRHIVVPLDMDVQVVHDRRETNQRRK